jgi:hypothetical protein
MSVLMVFETIIVLLCTSLETTSCAYVCFVLWHVNIYNNVMFGMFYVLCFMLYDYVPSVALILMHLVCIWHVKINLSNF